MEPDLLSEILAPIYRQALKKGLPYDVLSYIEYYIKLLYSAEDTEKLVFSEEYIRRDISAFAGKMEWPVIDIHLETLQTKLPLDLLSFLLNNNNLRFIAMPLIRQGTVPCYCLGTETVLISPSDQDCERDSFEDCSSEVGSHEGLLAIDAKSPETLFIRQSSGNGYRSETLESLIYSVSCMYLTSPIRTAWHVFIMVTQDTTIVESCLLRLDQSGIITIEDRTSFSLDYTSTNPSLRRVLVITYAISAHDDTIYKMHVATFFSYESKAWQLGVLQWGDKRPNDVYQTLGFPVNSWTRYTIPVINQRGLIVTDEIVANEIIMSAFLSHTIRNSYSGIAGSKDINVHCIGARVVERLRTKLAATDRALYIIRGIGPWMAPTASFLEFATKYDNSDITDETKDLTITKADPRYYGWDLFLYPTLNHEKRDPKRLAFWTKEATTTITVKRARRVSRKGDSISRSLARKRSDRKKKGGTAWGLKQTSAIE